MPEISRQEYEAMLAKNAALMGLTAVRVMMELSTFDVNYGNPANWRVLYHNSLDAFIGMPGTVEQRTGEMMLDVAVHSARVFYEQFMPKVEPVPPMVLTVNLVKEPGDDGKALAAALADAIKGHPGLVVESLTINVVDETR